MSFATEFNLHLCRCKCHQNNVRTDGQTTEMIACKHSCGVRPIFTRGWREVCIHCIAKTAWWVLEALIGFGRAWHWLLCVLRIWSCSRGIELDLDGHDIDYVHSSVWLLSWIWTGENAQGQGEEMPSMVANMGTAHGPDGVGQQERQVQANCNH